MKKLRISATVLVAVMFITSFVSLKFLLFLPEIASSASYNTSTWILAGAVIGLGAVIPGLSPSNFLLLLNIYQPMLENIKNLYLPVLLLIFTSLFLTVVLLSKIMNFILKKAHSLVFHSILGIIFASTIAIIPVNYNYLSFSGIICAGILLLGIFFGLSLTKNLQ